MKLKLNLNVDSAKRLLIQHGEKAGFGLAVCVLLWFLWKTLALEVLPADKEAGPLAALAERTRQHVVNSAWDPTSKNIKIVDYPARAEHVPLGDGDYPPLVVFYDKPLWEQHDKRPIPKVLPVEELVAASWQGFLAVKKEGEEAGKAEAGSETHSTGGSSGSRGAKLSKDLMSKGFFYVAVTGLVPVRKQIAAYDDAFRSAQHYDAGRDTPQYQEIKVERAVVAGANPTQVTWKEIDLSAVGSFVSTWSTESISDVVDEDYIGDYTMRLGPLLSEEWKPAIAGHPKIPLAARFEQTKKPEKEVVVAPVEPNSIFGTGKPKPGTKTSGGAQPKSNAAAPAGKTPVVSKREFKLFRFVDYTVEPGKQYCYRVKLGLQNPNHDVPDRFLKEPDLSHTPTLETDWSAPTPVVTVARGYNIYAGPVVKPTPHDPEVEICVVSFEPARGGEPATKKMAQRGTMLNFPAKDVSVMMPGAGVTKWPKVDFRSNALVVDVEGGRKLGNGRKPLIEPIEILVLDADGRASVHDELDDAKDFHARLDLLEPKEQTEAAPVATKNPYEELSPRGRGTRPPRGTAPPATKPPRTPAT